MASQTRTAIGLLLLLAALTLALFWPATGYDYVKLDDDQYVAGNPHVQTGLTSANVRWAFTAIYEDWWLPLLWLSFQTDTELFGPEPFGHHLANVLLHAANVALLFWFLFRATGSRWRSFFVAALFAVHPLRVESVAWITARKDVLSGLFFFLALLAYLRHVERPSAARMGLLAALMLLGLVSKAILIVLPLVLLFLDYWPLRRANDPWGPGSWKRWRPLLLEKLPLFGLAILFVAVNVRTHWTGGDVTFADLSLTTRIGLVPPNYWAYLKLIFWPAHLSILYPENDMVNWTISTAAAAGLIAITLLFLRFRQKAPYGIVGWLWFLLALVPVIRGVRGPGLAAYADRYVYLPSIGLAIALVWGVAAGIDKRPALKIPAYLLGGLLLCACLARSALRLPDWKNSETMFSRLIEFAPDNGLALNSYGKVLLEKGETEEALPYFFRASELGNPVAVCNYADALIRLGRDPEAIAWLERILATFPLDHLDIHTLLGMAYLNEDRAGDAIPHLQRAIQASSTPIGLQIALVRAEFEIGDDVAARQEIRTLQDFGYPHIRDFDGLVVYYAQLGQSGKVRQAWSFFRNNLRRHPDHVAMLNNAAWCLATTDNPPAPPEEALRLARRAAELAPVAHPGILDTLAAALAANGLFEEAKQTAQQALELAHQSGDTPTATQIELRLDAFQRHEPWRNKP